MMRSGTLAALCALCVACASGGKKPTAEGGGGGEEETGGSTGSGGKVGSTGGKVGSTGGTVGSTGGAVGSTGGAGASPDSGAGGSSPPDAAAGGPDLGAQPRFSFFVTSLVAMRRLSKSQNGFGGDLRYGTPDGLTGADKICTEIAESVRPGAGAKGWHAFLSVTKGPAGTPVNAIDRIGEGPWYDFKGRILAMNKAALLYARPMGADPAIINDLPNEFGIPNQRPDLSMPAVDNHHFLTGSNTMGQLYGPTATCKDWTALTGAGRPRIGFSFPEGGRVNWLSGQDEGGCGAGVNTAQTGGSDPSNPIVGSGGGYGGIYCFAMVP
jgi:hypothetical protein